ncbi:hypothetical protein G7A66_01315 [Altererythrobacter sp. SALINAS58]|uniref:hypothetical protein n=1 Tax=Alteripontixanthobacter muriae TaxID=2705546 RepID=UPI0015766125|nr:hypothetical protein [Alteripontixanthobacter muriae]NTZ41746.1 hypothetical protein [Alteripontixanthobacter muriae]
MWTAIFLIACIIAAVQMYKAKQRADNGIIADKEGNERYIERSDPDVQREVEHLRERVRVLERIAYEANTGSGRQSREISREIEALRDNTDTPEATPDDRMSSESPRRED